MLPTLQVFGPVKYRCLFMFVKTFRLLQQEFKKTNWNNGCNAAVDVKQTQFLKKRTVAWASASAGGTHSAQGKSSGFGNIRLAADDDWPGQNLEVDGNESEVGAGPNVLLPFKNSQIVANVLSLLAFVCCWICLATAPDSRSLSLKWFSGFRSKMDCSSCAGTTCKECAELPELAMSGSATAGSEAWALSKNPKEIDGVCVFFFRLALGPKAWKLLLWVADAAFPISVYDAFSSWDSCR